MTACSKGPRSRTTLGQAAMLGTFIPQIGRGRLWLSLLPCIWRPRRYTASYVWSRQVSRCGGKPVQEGPPSRCPIHGRPPPHSARDPRRINAGRFQHRESAAASTRHGLHSWPNLSIASMPVFPRPASWTRFTDSSATGLPGLPLRLPTKSLPGRHAKSPARPAPHLSRA